MKDDMLYGLLVHLGRNMWNDAEAADHLRCDMKVWNDITEHLKGFLTAPWFEMKKGKWDFERGKYLVACEQLAGARGIVRHFRTGKWGERHD